MTQYLKRLSFNCSVPAFVMTKSNEKLGGITLFDKTDLLAVNTLRTLSMEAIQAANSGHPGLPLGAAPMAYVLWSRFMKINPATSRNLPDRDRFILSAGHG